MNRGDGIHFLQASYHLQGTISFTFKSLIRRHYEAGARPVLLEAIIGRQREAAHITMTSYISSLTLPGYIFERPAAAVLLPVLFGTGVGFSMRRTRPLPNSLSSTRFVAQLTLSSEANPGYLSRPKTASSQTSSICLRPSMDKPLCRYGLRLIPRLDHGHGILEHS